MTRSIFYGFGAWVGTQSGATQCSWWPNDPSDPSINWDASKLIPTDLAKNPYAVTNSALPIAQLQCDDRPTYGGITTIGPTWPSGETIGGCWLEKGDYDALPPNKKPARPPPYMPCRAYELVTVKYWPDGGDLANRRFFGFYAEIVSEQGPNALTSIWKAGSSMVPGKGPQGSWWLDLGQIAHPIENQFTQIGVGVGVPKQGALFIDTATISSLGLFVPKLPPAEGADEINHVR